MFIAVPTGTRPKCAHRPRGRQAKCGSFIKRNTPQAQESELSGGGGWGGGGRAPRQEGGQGSPGLETVEEEEELGIPFLKKPCSQLPLSSDPRVSLAPPPPLYLGSSSGSCSWSQRAHPRPAGPRAESDRLPSNLPALGLCGPLFSLCCLLHFPTPSAPGIQRPLQLPTHP